MNNRTPTKYKRAARFVNLADSINNTSKREWKFEGLYSVHKCELQV